MKCSPSLSVARTHRSFRLGVHLSCRVNFFELNPHRSPKVRFKVACCCSMCSYPNSTACFWCSLDFQANFRPLRIKNTPDFNFLILQILFETLVSRPLIFYPDLTAADLLVDMFSFVSPTMTRWRSLLLLSKCFGISFGTKGK